MKDADLELLLPACPQLLKLDCRVESWKVVLTAGQLITLELSGGRLRPPPFSCDFSVLRATWPHRRTVSCDMCTARASASLLSTCCHWPACRSCLSL
jgi:hypothetical protein